MDAVDPSRIQRIVLLIDLHPLLALENPKPYLSSVLTAARRILSFPAISSSLAAFKLFFSSLSPILSTSKFLHLLGKSPTFLSFDRPLQTLERLVCTLSSLSSIESPLESPRSAFSRASIVAGSLLQLGYDYAWEPQIRHFQSMLDALMIRSNLVVLFSPIPQTLSCLSEYFNEGSLLSFDTFLEKFLQIFGLAKERLALEDIHVCWVDVTFRHLCKEEGLGLEYFEEGIKELGWGCYNTNAIVLGSALIPFGLIFPCIGCTIGARSLRGLRKNHAELILCIKDSGGAALECKSCDLDVFVLKVFEERSDIPCLYSKNSEIGSTKIRIREVRKMNGGTMAIENSCALILLHGISGASRKETSGSYKQEIIADKVLELLCNGHGELDAGKPIWQLILTFLYNRNYSALVSILDDHGTSVDGILQPFALNYALLSIFPRNLDVSMSIERFDNDNRGKGNRTQIKLLQNISWGSFCQTIFTQSDDFASAIDLEELYFNLMCTRSKKLRFLKCWMKQIKKSNRSDVVERNKLTQSLGVKEVKDENQGLLHESECGSSAGVNFLSRSTSQLSPSFVCIEDSKAFFESIPQKIEYALCSKDVDLFILAERLVVLSIDSLCTKHGRDTTEDIGLEKEQNSFEMKIATEISSLLLVKPKDLELKCKSSNSASSTTEPTPVNYSTEEKIRVHELQILFRMEILQLKVASTFDESLKKKLIKDICSLLQNIEFYLHDDFFGGESLLEYATRTIKSRYEHSLRDVIHEIYDKMEFFSFHENEVEASDLVPARNDDGLKRDIKFSRNNQTTDYINEDHVANQLVLESTIEQQLTEAQEKRNRARRFSSFTSWVPDLQRVWALRHPMPKKHEHQTLARIKSKKRKRRSHSTMHDRVCETP